MKILIGVLALLCLQGTSFAASSLTMSFDPRIELLGVVQYLAGGGRGKGAAIPKSLELEKSFGRFRTHPAVKSYAAALKRGRGAESFGLILFFLGDPPELAFKSDRSLISRDFIRAAGGRAALDAFLADLRDFARASRFSDFYARHEADYKRFEAEARRELGGRDDLHAIEAYVGRDLDSRVHLVLTAAYQPGSLRYYIVPYPYRGPHVKVDGPFDVYSLLPPWSSADGSPAYGLEDPLRSGVWNELLYVVVEQGYAEYGDDLQGLSRLHAAVAGDCLQDWDGCSRHIIVHALGRRLERAVPGGGRERAEHGALEGYIAAVSKRLGEYEKDRKKYPTLDSFYPRIVDAFRELAKTVPDR